MEFNSRLLKLNDDADILEEHKGLTPEQLKVLIALLKNQKIREMKHIICYKESILCNWVGCNKVPETFPAFFI